MTIDSSPQLVGATDVPSRSSTINGSSLKSGVFAFALSSSSGEPVTILLLFTLIVAQCLN